MEPVNLSPSSFNLSVISRSWPPRFTVHFQVPVGFGLSSARSAVSEPANVTTNAATKSRFMSCLLKKNRGLFAPSPAAKGIDMPIGSRCKKSQNAALLFGLLTALECGVHRRFDSINPRRRPTPQSKSVDCLTNTGPLRMMEESSLDL